MPIRGQDGPFAIELPDGKCENIIHPMTGDQTPFILCNDCDAEMERGMREKDISCREWLGRIGWMSGKPIPWDPWLRLF